MTVVIVKIILNPLCLSSIHRDHHHHPHHHCHNDLTDGYWPGLTRPVSQCLLFLATHPDSRDGKGFKREWIGFQNHGIAKMGGGLLTIKKTCKYFLQYWQCQNFDHICDRMKIYWQQASDILSKAEWHQASGILLPKAPTFLNFVSSPQRRAAATG